MPPTQWHVHRALQFMWCVCVLVGIEGHLQAQAWERSGTQVRPTSAHEEPLPSIPAVPVSLPPGRVLPAPAP